ncbi:MAG: IS200/IS605 family transposase [Parcubacteria group bacterium]|jgi:REP element-mobilizing transposase RayT
MSEHIKKSHNVSLLIYHLVCPAKYRRKVFEGIEGVEEELKNICQEIEDCYDIHFLEIGADKDHVHFLIQSVPMISPTNIAKITKSITARMIFKRKPEVKRMLWGGQFWTKGYYISTVSKNRTEIVVSEYVRNQGLEYKQIYRNQRKLFEGI